MTVERFERLIEWATPRGLQLHSALEYRVIDGVGGMYAKSDIAAGELLASFPKSSLPQPNSNDYPAQASTAARFIHTASREWERGKQSEFHPFFAMFDTHDNLQTYAAYFMDQEALKRIGEASPKLAQHITLQQQRHKALLDGLCQFDSNIARSTYETLILAYDSRAMGKAGFVPVIDCFNHHDLKGSMIEHHHDAVCIHAAEAYPADQQVHISYGQLDLYTHGVNYHYFDPAADHRLRADIHFALPVLSALHQRALQPLSTRFKLQLERTATGIVARLLDPTAHLTQAGPSKTLVSFANEIAKLGLYGHTTNEVIRGMLSRALEQNSIAKIQRKYFPRAYRRFYDILQREQAILQQNLERLK
ncbi:MAG: SET domain-containing protein [Oleiphilaceae bacterium]|nr:SET domain-containing protein [Oleiphilaceae bacterium]